MKYYAISEENFTKFQALLGDLPHKITLAIAQAMGEIKQVEVEEPKADEPDLAEK